MIGFLAGFSSLITGFLRFVRHGIWIIRAFSKGKWKALVVSLTCFRDLRLGVASRYYYFVIVAFRGSTVDYYPP